MGIYSAKLVRDLQRECLIHAYAKTYVKEYVLILQAKRKNWVDTKGRRNVNCKFDSMNEICKTCIVKVNAAESLH